MLAFTRETQTKLDDMFVLLCGVFLFAAPIARAAGVIQVPFEYLEVVFGAILPILVAVGKWVYFVYKRASTEQQDKVVPPDPITALLVAMAVFHLLPIWQVNRVAENSNVSNLWLFAATYFLVAAALGRYLWPLEFFSMWKRGAVAVVHKAQDVRARRILQNGLHRETDVVTPVTMERFDSPPAPRGFEPPPPPQLDPSRLVTQESHHVAAPQLHTLLKPPLDLIDQAIAGEQQALGWIIQKLGDADIVWVRSIMTTDGGMPPNTFENVMVPAINGDRDVLLRMLRHPAFAQRQRPALDRILNS